jgi:HSP20 family protein
MASERYAALVEDSMALRPFDLLDDFNRAYGNLFRSPLFRAEGEGFAGGDWLPPADVRDEADRYVIVMDVPGVVCDQVEITVHEGVLTVKGRRETEARKNEHHMIRIERTSGRFIRQFQLPGVVDADSVDASLKDGVLTIELPKARESAPKKITVR